MNWKENFDRQDLLKGLFAFRQGRISPLICSGHHIQAVVDEICQVDAAVEDGYVTELHCSCPEGRHGRFCSHEAALLYAIESQMDESDSKIRQDHADTELALRDETELASSDQSEDLYDFGSRKETDHNEQTRTFLLDRDKTAEGYRQQSPVNRASSVYRSPFVQRTDPLFSSPRQQTDNLTDPDEDPLKSVIDYIASQYGLHKTPAEKERTDPKVQNETADHEQEFRDGLSASDLSELGSETDEPEPALQTNSEESAPQIAEPAGSDQQDVSVDRSQPDHLLKRTSVSSEPELHDDQKAEETDPTDRNALNKEPGRETPETDLTLDVLIRQLSRDEFEKITLGYARKHSDFENYLVASMAGVNPAAVKSWLEAAAEQKVQTLLSGGSISFRRSAKSLQDDFASWFDDQIQALEDNHQIIYAAELIESVLSVLENYSAIETEEAILGIGNHCFLLLEKLLNRADETVIQDVFSWIEMQMENDGLPDFHRQLLDLLERPCFDLEQLALLKYRSLLRQLKSLMKQGKSYPIRERLIQSVLRLENSWPAVKEQEPEFIHSYSQLPQVLIEKARQELSEGRNHLAERDLNLARRGKLSTAQEEAAIRMLAQIHVQNGQEDLAMRELNELIFILQGGFLEDVLLLQKLENSSQWKEDLQRLEQFGDTDLLLQLYQETGDQEKLMDLLADSGQFHDLIHCEQMMNQIDPERAGKAWLRAAREMSETAHERTDYRKCAIALSKALQTASCKEEAQNLAEQIRNKNHRRPAFLEELEKAGL